MGVCRSTGDGIAGKKFWITGAANGIGNAVAKGLVLEGCSGVAVVDIVTETDGEFMCKKLETDKTKVVYYRCDVRDESGIEWCMRAAKKALGGLDVVINNAGIVDEDSLARCMAVNVEGVVNGTEAALRLGVRRVVNVGSAAGVFPLAEGAYYAASKHAVVGYSKSVGLRVRDKAKVCCVCPGFIAMGIGVGRGWTDGGVGVMKVERFVEFFLSVVRGEYGDGRVLYVSERLGGREIGVDVGRRLALAKL